MQFYVYKYKEEKQYSFHHPRVLCKKKKKKSEFNIHLRTGKNIFVSLDIVKKGIPFIGWTSQDPTSNTFGHIML